MTRDRGNGQRGIVKTVIEWCDEMGHSEHEILDLIRRIVSANPRKEAERKDNRKNNG